MNTLKQWLSNIWTKSWTTGLGWVKVIGGLFMALGAYLGGIVNDSNVHSALGAMNLPAEIGLGVAVLGAMVLFSEAHA